MSPAGGSRTILPGRRARDQSRQQPVIAECAGLRDDLDAVRSPAGHEGHGHARNHLAHDWLGDRLPATGTACAASRPPRQKDCAAQGFGASAHPSRARCAGRPRVGPGRTAAQSSQGTLRPFRGAPTRSALPHRRRPAASARCRTRRAAPRSRGGRNQKYQASAAQGRWRGFRPAPSRRVPRRGRRCRTRARRREASFRSMTMRRRSFIGFRVPEADALGHGFPRLPQLRGNSKRSQHRKQVLAHPAPYSVAQQELKSAACGAPVERERRRDQAMTRRDRPHRGGNLKARMAPEKAVELLERENAGSQREDRRKPRGCCPCRRAVLLPCGAVDGKLLRGCRRKTRVHEDGYCAPRSTELRGRIERARQVVGD